ncbi:MAG TPA: DUF1501 domain-containing protein [Saprospiraceae bacterium]|nr:DUF1501 domain-containing protein [Saprospiraceae bacterium]HMQ85281.1 DUF1501 domain-containing protein [Saprospiraceae bacterium]
MKRRKFLEYTAAGAAGMSVPHFLPFFGAGKMSTSPWVRLLNKALTETDHVLVLIRLDGGNDGLNTVVPIDQFDRLANARPHVILPENSLLGLDGQDSLGFHPAMADMRALYDEGKMKIIQSVGYPNQDFSHFRSSDIWMTAADSDEVFGTGWAGRYLQYEYPNYPADFPNETMPDPPSLEIGPTTSLTLQGPLTSMGISIFNPEEFYELVEGVQTPAPNTPAGELLTHIRTIARQSNSYGAVVTEAYQSASNIADYPADNYLAEQLAIVARLINGGLKTKIYLVSISGFDTHDSQVNVNDHTQGEHANLLRQLSQAVGAFMQDIQLMGISERVIGMTFSEFGRRIISNDSNGTDHGAAAPMFVFGHHVDGGVLGDNPNIPNNAQWDDNIPMQYDFRSIYSSVLKDWFCVPGEDIEGIMLHDFQSLPILSPSACTPTSTRDLNHLAGKQLLDVWPNPFSQQVRLQFQAEGRTLIQVFNNAGQLVATPVNKHFPKGTHQIDCNLGSLPTGLYHFRIQNGPMQQVRAVVKQ